MVNLIASQLPLKLTTDSPCFCLRNNDDDDQDTAEAGSDVEALGEVKVVLAGETVGEVDCSHPLSLHHLKDDDFISPQYRQRISKVENEKRSKLMHNY